MLEWMKSWSLFRSAKTKESQGLFLIVGLGNPGAKYAMTRHNIGYMVADLLAERNGIEMKKETRMKGWLGKGKAQEADFFLLKPATYMNHSGESVGKVVRYYQVPMPKILTVSDEIALPFGKMRLSEKGSAGGHKGLENIELNLGTQHYARLRFGIGDRKEGDLADYVLSTFTEEELAALPELIEQAALAVEAWMNQGSEAARRLLPEVKK